MLSFLRTITKLSIILVLALLSSYQHVFPRHLDVCALKKFHLGVKPPFPAFLRPLAEDFWGSDFAPACIEKPPPPTILQALMTEITQSVHQVVLDVVSGVVGDAFKEAFPPAPSPSAETVYDGEGVVSFDTFCKWAFEVFKKYLKTLISDVKQGLYIGAGAIQEHYLRSKNAVLEVFGEVVARMHAHFEANPLFYIVIFFAVFFAVIVAQKCYERVVQRRKEQLRRKIQELSCPTKLLANILILCTGNNVIKKLDQCLIILNVFSENSAEIVPKYFRWLCDERLKLPLTLGMTVTHEEAQARFDRAKVYFAELFKLWEVPEIKRLLESARVQVEALVEKADHFRMQQETLHRFLIDNDEAYGKYAKELGLDPAATVDRDAIKRYYRALARLYHPDKFDPLKVSERGMTNTQAEKRMQRINEAKEFFDHYVLLQEAVLEAHAALQEALQGI